MTLLFADGMEVGILVSLVSAVSTGIGMILGRYLPYRLQCQKAELEAKGIRDKAKLDADALVRKAEIEAEATIKQAELAAEQKLVEETRSAYVQALDQAKDLVGRLEAQCRRHETGAVEQGRTIERLNRLHSECREMSAEQRQVIIFLYSALKSQHTAMARAGIEPGFLPDMPSMREHSDEAEAKDRSASHEAEFLTRQTEHNTSLIAEAGVEIVKEKGGGGANHGPEKTDSAGDR